MEPSETSCAMDVPIDGNPKSKNTQWKKRSFEDLTTNEFKTRIIKSLTRKRKQMDEYGSFLHSSSKRAMHCDKCYKTMYVHYRMETYAEGKTCNALVPNDNDPCNGKLMTDCTLMFLSSNLEDMSITAP